MLTEKVDYGHKIEKEVRSMQSETKRNVQGTNSEGKETETQINSLDKNCLLYTSDAADEPCGV